MIAPSLFRQPRNLRYIFLGDNLRKGVIIISAIPVDRVMGIFIRTAFYLLRIWVRITDRIRFRLCPIEKAFRAGKTDLYKPISCHLYPIRIGDYGPYKAVNYHRWNVCKAAVLLGQKENLPVYKFLKEPLVRKFGEEWYKELEIAAEELQRRGMM